MTREEAIALANAAANAAYKAVAYANADAYAAYAAYNDADDAYAAELARIDKEYPQ